VEYLEVARAKELPGLRLVLSAGVPGPWGEAAKGIFGLKGIPYVAVRQVPGAPNPELLAWTGRDNAPVAVYEDEPPRSGWAEILYLAERLAPEPRLVPEDPEARAWMFGLAHALCGEEGFGWCRRLMLIDAARRGGAVAVADTLARKYGWSPEAAKAAPARCAEILRLFSERIRGRHTLVGDRLTALDVYWAAFAALVEPLPEAQCPLGPGLRALYTVADSVVREACSAELLAHRDRVYREHLRLPLDF
jgi:glutathione S-transferase